MDPTSITEAAQQATSLGIGTMITAAGALGIAASGIVDAFKFSQRFRTAGYGQLAKVLTPEVVSTIEGAYGSADLQYLRALYVEQRKTGALGKALRQGIRVALDPETAAGLARAFGFDEDASARLTAIAEKLFARGEEGSELTDAERGLLGRFELAADTRIEAALVLAELKYVGAMRWYSLVVALVIAFAAAFPVATTTADWLTAAVIGGAAVPLAPIAKDVAGGIRSARDAMGVRK